MDRSLEIPEAKVATGEEVEETESPIATISTISNKEINWINYLNEIYIKSLNIHFSVTFLPSNLDHQSNLVLLLVRDWSWKHSVEPGLYLSVVGIFVTRT